MKSLRIVSLFTCVALFCIESNAQFNQYRLNHDRDPYYFGLSVGYNYSVLHTTRSKEFLQQPAFTRIEPKGSHGLEFGLLSTARIYNNLEARIAPKLVIGGSKSLSYYYDADYIADKPSIQNNPEVIRLPATMVSVPLHVKLSSDRLNNFRVYMFAGPKYDINLAANSEEYKKARQLDLYPPPQIRQNQLGYEFGAGFSIYLPFTVVSPEIKIGNYFGNSHISDPSNPYSNVLHKMNTRMIQFTLNFEE